MKPPDLHLLEIKRLNGAEKLVAVNVTEIKYDAKALQQAIDYVHQYYPDRVPVYFSMWATNDNTLFLDPVTAANCQAALPEINTKADVLERYYQALQVLKDKY